MNDSNRSERERALRLLFRKRPPPARNPGPCPDALELAGYGDGRLLPAERDRIEAHLARCADCLENVAGIEEGGFTEEEAAGMPSVKLTPSGAQRRGWPALAAAAAILLLAAGLWHLVGDEGEASPVHTPGVDSRLFSAARELERDLPETFAGFVPLDRDRRQNPDRPVLRGEAARALSPAFRILSDRPSFRWASAPGSAAYDVIVMSSRGIVFRRPHSASADADGTVTMPYPVDAPSLLAGEVYTWSPSGADDFGVPRVPLSISVASPAERERLRRGLEEIAIRSPSTEAAVLQAHFAIHLGLLVEGERLARAALAAEPGIASAARETLYVINESLGTPEAAQFR